MSLPVFQATIVNDNGDIIPSAVMTVLDEITGLGLTVYSNRAGTVPLGTNGVFTAGTDGFAQFFAPAGNYRVKAEQAASGFEKTWDFVPLVGGSAFDVDSYTAFGLGGHVDLRGTIYETGAPADLISKGEIFGLCDNSVLGIPELAPSDFGSLHVSIQWNSTSSAILGAYHREFKIDGKTFVQFAATSSTWSAWQRTDPQAFGLGGNATTTTNLDDNLTGGKFAFGAGATGSPFNYGTLEVISRTPAEATQIATSVLTGLIESRYTSGGSSGWQAWQPVYTGANYQPETIGGIGVVQMMQNASGGNQFAGNDYAGSLLRFTKFVAGVPTADGTPVTSVWKYLGNSTLTNLDFSMYVRKS